MHTILSIAGSDSSGGAGIQADLKTITCLGEYGMTVITALTAQNTTGVESVEETSVNMVKAQMDAVFRDIFPEAVKLGMIATPDIMEAVCEKLVEYQAKNVVVDPVMVATSGSSLMEDGTVQTLKEKLLPLADVITPNIYEAEVLSGISVEGKGDMVKAAEKIAEGYSGAILIKGGHLENSADDLLYRNGEGIWFSGERIDNENTHGTGCTLSSAIAVFLAKGYSVAESVEQAKAYVAEAIAADLNLGKGRGPLWHNYKWTR
ncbi:MAG: bifunctional hydroxymethylpyrimidine kinase/phosphomethylpyrimidine kinase [Bacteroidales bacterium]|nr:bifunctional hydroxymethylpyrimidine kinase/phosphomethylpyrimidine kinase [Clostridium sp.]MCM1204493.1 bifunctional hydroxymethylpyrimidine kinase/phosphomethylpyrimidine kinase [Bacteroidales bacterium]